MVSFILFATLGIPFVLALVEVIRPDLSERLIREPTARTVRQ